MTTEPLLSILMPALASRASNRMRPLIEAQIASRSNVEFLVELDNGEMPSGAKRQRLLERATGRYVAFVDDDDEVVEDYVEALVERCNGTVDVVTFWLDFIRGGVRAEQWRFGLQGDYRPRGLMAANHLCAWRVDLARRVSWLPISYADDQAWYGPLHASGLVRTETHIPRALYRYLWSALTTVNQEPARVKESKRYAGDGLPCFRDAAGELYTQDGGTARPGETVRVYHRGRLVEIPRAGLEQFHVVRFR